MTAFLRRLHLVIGVLVAVTLTSYLPSSAAPSIFWASDPVAAGEAVMLIGDDLKAVTSVVISSASNLASDEGLPSESSVKVAPLSKTSTSLFFGIPPKLPFGIYNIRLINADKDVKIAVNTPQLYWGQFIENRLLCVFGKNVVFSNSALLRIKDLATNTSVTLPMSYLNSWSAMVEIPQTIGVGDFLVSVWNGYGDIDAWSNPILIHINTAGTANRAQVSISEFGAKGDGKADDTNAFAAGFAALSQTGGTLYLPIGRFLVSRSLAVPDNVNIKGSGRDVSSLLWPDFDTPPQSLITLSRNSAIEDLSIYASNHFHIISAGFDSGRQASDIYIRNIRIRGSAYRGHVSKSVTTLRASMLEAAGPNGADAVRLQGKRLRLLDSDILSSESPLLILDAEDVVISRNKLYDGRGGWYSISGSQKVIFDHNEVVGGDFGASGGGVNNLFSSNNGSEDIWIYGNIFRNFFGWDREALTSDGPGGGYYGSVVPLSCNSFQLAHTNNATQHSLIGQGFFILQGRGMGQYAEVKYSNDNHVLLDRCLQVLPDGSSNVTIVPRSKNYMIVGNYFSDAGVAAQFYGTAVNHIVADNMSDRTAGFINIGRWYHHFQPSWYIEYLHNKIEDGTVYRGGPDNSIFSGEGEIGVYGLSHGENSPPLTLGIVVRGNKLSANSRISLGGCSPKNPSIRSVLVERNTILNKVRPLVGISAECDILGIDNHFSVP